MKKESKSKQVVFTEIDWDCSTRNQLPKTVKMDVDINADIEEEGADLLSDEYGWCVNSFYYDIIE